MKNITGFSLVELMIAASLSLILLSMLMSVYWLVKRDYGLEQAEATIQQNASIASYLLRQDISMAGFLGCAKIADVLSSIRKAKLKPSLAFPHRLSGSVGNNESWQPALAEKLLNKVKPNTDVLMLWYRSKFSYPVLLIADKTWRVKASIQPFKDGDTLLISSCRQAELLRYRLHPPIKTAVFNDQEEAEIAKFNHYAYYISKSEYRNLSAQPVYGLFRKSLLAHNTRAQELVEGIEAMKVSYGVKLNASKTLVFYKANQVKRWQDVKIVCIHLLMTSVEEVLKRPQPYQFCGQLHKPLDRILRKEWLVYVYLRQA